jgi:Iap family predicted aminopeptidase
MQTIFILTTEKSECFGHGDYGTIINMAYEGYGTPYPVFLTKEDADSYIKEKNLYSVKPKEYQIYQS